MYLLYLDDSGSVSNPAESYFILAGVAIHEHIPHKYEKAMDDIIASVWPGNPRSIEFRGSDIFNGRKRWRSVEKDVRIHAYEQTLNILEGFDSEQARLFGAVIHKAAPSLRDPMEYAFEQLCSRFDQFLRRLYKSGEDQQGLIILDNSTYETHLQNLAINFRNTGHTWGRLLRLAEVPLFVDSKATRLIQFADLVAYALRQYYERKDPRYFDLISHKFDNVGGIVHGLIHHVPSNQSCDCPSCIRRSS
ncbi:MAG: DUF3800 domain-containing protein [Hyphomicrobiales bacterium]|nr:DUF3800 domain-containing protein [Hyphomicrobiales bacterium]MCY4048029.1 DUF3800 domain-containing protein [Hyphomicrobiales bacterium]MCY4052293.1 DUF3800 domain-containing protein [Hyphomicrobiales bacterium]